MTLRSNPFMFTLGLSAHDTRKMLRAALACVIAVVACAHGPQRAAAQSPADTSVRSEDVAIEMGYAPNNAVPYARPASDRTLLETRIFRTTRALRASGAAAAVGGIFMGAGLVIFARNLCLIDCAEGGNAAANAGAVLAFSGIGLTLGGGVGLILSGVFRRRAKRQLRTLRFAAAPIVSRERFGAQLALSF